MFVKAKVIAMAVLLVAAYGSLALAQATPPTILEVDVENFVNYQASMITDLSTITLRKPHAAQFAGDHARKHGGARAGQGRGKPDGR